MKWNGHWEYDKSRITLRKYVYGIKDWILLVAIYLGAFALLVGFFFLRSFRWTL